MGCLFFVFQLIPGDMTFSTADNIPCYQSSDQTVSLAKDDEVRLKIVGTRIDAAEIVSFFIDRSNYFVIDFIRNIRVSFSSSSSLFGLSFMIFLIFFLGHIVCYRHNQGRLSGRD
jgi:DNA-directed RNA polymerase subunit E'/Rpb7